MKTYESYKESNKTAIGLIPSEWNITSIKNILEIPITDGPHTTPEFYDEGIPFLSAEAVKNGKLDFNKKRGFISEEDFNLYSQKYLPKKGDIFMVKSGATTGNTAMVETDDIFNIWSPLAVFRANKQKVYPKYLHYYLTSPNFKSLVEISWSYGTQQNIGMGVLSNLPISYPTNETQAQIANYLDHKTQIIDALIEKKEQLIQKLQAQRQAIINEAVTKGLNTNAKMKDSGIEWLGEIPEHWLSAKIKFVSTIQGRIGFKGYRKEDLVREGEGALTLGAKHIDKENRLDLYDPEFISWEKYYESPEIMVKLNDVIFTQRGSLGKVCHINKDIGEATINPSMVILTPKENIIPRYLYFWLCSDRIRNEVSLFQANTAVPMISQFQLGNFPIIIPELEEQNEIVNHIDQSLIVVKKLTDKTTKSLKKLKSYRQSIISEAVTGKIDVRDWQPKK